MLKMTWKERHFLGNQNWKKLGDSNCTEEMTQEKKIGEGFTGPWNTNNIREIVSTLFLFTFRFVMC